MKALNLQKVQNDFFVPLCNLFYDEALKELKPSEFRTYITIIYVVKAIGPNTQTYFASKKELLKRISELINVSEKTFLKHLKTFESRGLLKIEGKAIDIGFDISDSKSGGYTPINILDLEYLILNLDNNELKLYLTIYRLIKGFNKKSSKLTYSQLKKWSGIKNKAIFIDTRNSLRDKNIIIAMHDIESNTYQYKLKEFSNGFIFSTEDKEPHQVEKEQYNKLHKVEKKPHIKKYNPFQKKYFKKSYGDSKNPNYQNKAKEFEKQNLEKIFLFLSENIKTKHMDNTERLELIELLIDDLAVNGGFKGVKIKSNPLFYLAQEHSQFGRNLDKILERHFARIDQEKRDNEARKLFLEVLNNHFPKECRGLSDFKINDISKNKLDKLIQQSPGIGYFSEEFLFEELEVLNPDFKKEVELESQTYMKELIFDEIGNQEVSMDERLVLIQKFIPIVCEKFPPQSEFIIKKRRLGFFEFCEKYKKIQTEYNELEKEYLKIRLENE